MATELASRSGGRGGGDATRYSPPTSPVSPPPPLSPSSQVVGAQTRAKSAASSSTILIKYNYYDQNGQRHEQQNEDMNCKPRRNRVQRLLSPTFKQSLDQIVRSGHLAATGSTSTAGSSPPPPPPLSSSSCSSSSASPRSRSTASSPTWPPAQVLASNEKQNLFANPIGDQNSATMLLRRRYKMSSYEQHCLRCLKRVYQMDKVGPLKDFTFYHKNCFKCRECGTKLTLKTYFNNQHCSTDREVYCHRHCPKTPPGKLDNQSVGIRTALDAPKVFELQLAASCCGGGRPLSPEAGAAPLSPRQPNGVDGRALHIQHAVQQTRLLQAAGVGPLARVAHHSQVGVASADQQLAASGQIGIAQFISRRLEFLEPRQKLLEAQHRQEEEALFKAFEQKWRQEELFVSEQIRTEWQAELNKLLEKYKRQLSSALGGAAKSRAAAAQQVAAQPPPQAHKVAPEEQRLIELERLNLEKTMTIKLDRKRETLKRKLKEFERHATAELVEKQSGEMLQLISVKLAEFKEEQKRKIGSDLEQFEAMELLASQLGVSLQLATAGSDAAAAASAKKRGAPQAAWSAERAPTAAAAATPATAAEPPAQAAPQLSKLELYNCKEADEVFGEIDALAINVAREDQQTFTDLVHHLTRNCLSDVEKVRAIFRWITVKNLNTMHFDSTIKPDTPLGLLRGIKQGSESYHVLFKRLCSYAGLHCAVVKGYSKSAGYQPGVRFEGNRFRNSWNAVYVAGAWRFVQCNWGARHLVSVAVMSDKTGSSTSAAGARQPRRQPQLDGTPKVPISVPGARSQRAASGGANLGRRGSAQAAAAAVDTNGNLVRGAANGAEQTPASALSPTVSSASNCSSSYSTSSSLSTSSSSPCPSFAANGQRKQAAAAPQNGAGGCNDSLRYEYDDHYFLTDPDEFIYEFFPLQTEWQLLKTRPISLQEFEQLPFVRSLFFKYGLYFPQPNIKSVLYTDSSGATTIKIGIPTHLIPSLIFHYNLKFFDSDCEQHEGVSLKRFVMQSVESCDSDGLVSNVVSFKVHVPENGAYILDIFANSTTPNQYVTGEPMKFKSVCKFKIVAKQLKTVMVPLPECASGEFGPMKATRLFGIIPITHEGGLITVQNERRFLEIQFRTTRPLLDLMSSLHKNNCDERQLSKAIKIFIDGEIIFITIRFPDDGQYGLDIYTSDQSVSPTARAPLAANPPDKPAPGAEKQLLTHCCKYLINVKAALPNK